MWSDLTCSSASSANMPSNSRVVGSTTPTNASTPFSIFSAKIFIEKAKNHTSKITTSKARTKRKRLLKLGISIC